MRQPAAEIAGNDHRPPTESKTSGGSPTTGSSRTIRSAEADPKLSAIFLIGHKPIMDHPQAEEKAILNTRKHPLGDQLQALFQANDKVRAYICARQHLFVNVHRLKKARAGLASDRWQCRQQTEQQVGPARGHLLRGFSQINVYASGKVGLVNYQRPTPKPPQKYFERAPVKGRLPTSTGDHPVSSGTAWRR